jgi:hypothetical protein
MKRYMLIIICALLLMAALMAVSQGVLAQTGGGYDLSWNTLASGGWTSGGVYTMDSAIGQPFAGVVAGIADPGYSLCAGYLCGVQSTSRVYLPLVRK